ncbi:2-hydroxyacylsphingosine 1-beta-galactosyltransferase [Orchesella cincta]|uniref:UDP-glucuronosyltransferase n=1 Tax=Orchesella cincta TaxID=48709 RepID=A0A1D2MBM0_ORCCI|nr:2-hydroxyacylsphingosine 1-beta-galactosyltransferase [Orchesella cincta]
MVPLKLLRTLLLFSLMGTCFSERILFLLPLASRSHVNVFEPLMKALGERAHEIVNLSPIISSNMPPTVQQIQLITVDDLLGNMPNPFEQRKTGKLWTMLNSSSLDHMDKACIKVLETPRLYEMLEKEKFDLVIVDIFLNYCVLGVIPHFKAPSIFISTSSSPSFLTSVVDVLFGVMWDRMFVRKSEDMYRKYLPNGNQLPGLDEIQANSSLMFTNSHFTINYPRPLLPDVIEVGGMHTRPAKKLPKLGSIVKAKDMPENYRKVFLNVFAKLKQRVIWKWETETMPDLPPNVKLSKWLPQQDVLGHPNIRLFITHGGLLSTQESIYHGVPVLGIPMFADQDLNVMQAERGGYAKMVEIVGITEERLETALLELLGNPVYLQKAKDLSKLVQDLPQTPLEKAVYWTEYVLRHKGAPHLRSAARDLNFFQYYVLDVAAVLFVAFALVTYLILSCCKSIFKRICGKKSVKHVHFKKE